MGRSSTTWKSWVEGCAVPTSLRWELPIEVLEERQCGSNSKATDASKAAGRLELGDALLDPIAHPCEERRVNLTEVADDARLEHGLLLGRGHLLEVGRPSRSWLPCDDPTFAMVVSARPSAASNESPPTHAENLANREPHPHGFRSARTRDGRSRFQSCDVSASSTPHGWLVAIGILPWLGHSRYGSRRKCLGFWHPSGGHLGFLDLRLVSHGPRSVKEDCRRARKAARIVCVSAG